MRTLYFAGVSGLDFHSHGRIFVVVHLFDFYSKILSRNKLLVEFF